MSEIIPTKELKKIRDRKIRALSKLGYSMDQICAEMRELGNGVSKTTVFFAINGRSKKQERARTIRRSEQNKIKNSK